MWERIREIIRKEIRQTLREPRMRTILFVPPIVQMLVFGFAVNMDIERVRLGWMDLDRSAESRDLRESFVGAPTFVIARELVGDADAQGALDRGDVQAVVRVAAGFGADVQRGRESGVQVLIDGANSNTGAIVANYAAQVIGRHNAALLARERNRKLVARSQGGPVQLKIPGVRSATRVWFNPELKSRNYFVPGVIVNIITLVTLMLTALSIVREKEIGTMEQIMVTPIRPLDLMLGKTIPFLTVGLLDMMLVVGVALAVFRVPLRGNFLLLMGASLLFMMTTLGAGLFLSTISETQQQAMMGAFFFFNPAFMLSGFSFPIRNMPEVIQWLTYLNPLRYFMEIVRAVFLKGAGVSVLWPQMVALAFFGVLILGASAARFHKRLD